MAAHCYVEPTPIGRAGETVLPVWVEHWEIECCAPPPVVGEPSTWSLFFVPAMTDHPELAQTWSCSARPLLAAGQSEPFGAVLDIAGAAVFWHPDGAGVDQLPPGSCQLRGHLAGTWHGGSVPEEVRRTTGIVRRLRVASRTFARVTDGPWEPVPGTMTLTDRQRSPRSFQRGDLQSGNELRRQETAVLLDLAFAQSAG